MDEDWPLTDLDRLAPDVDIVGARQGFSARRRRRRRRTRAGGGVAVAAVVVVGAAGVRFVGDDSDTIVTTDSTVSSDSRVSTDATTPTESSSPEVPVPASTTPLATNTSSVPVATTAPGALRVMPFGVSGDLLPLRMYQNDIATGPSPIASGDVAVSYELQLGFPAQRAGVVEPATETTDGQLSIEVSCDVSDCTSFRPLTNQEIVATLRLTVRGTDVPLTAGEHHAEFRIRFDDATTAEFAVNFFAEPEPTTDLSDLVAASTGPPTRVQTVFGVGRFAYHAVAAFDSIWFLGHNSGTVTRVDARTGTLLATIPFGQPGAAPPSSNRLAATSDAVYAAGAPVIRIDPNDNSSTAITGGMRALGVIANDTTVWTAGFDGIQRVDADGTITTLDLPTRRWIDLAISNGLVWALNQEAGNTRLIAFDGTTGQLRHDLALETDGNEFAVRLVADDHNVVVGTDTSGGGGRTGRVILIDPETGSTTNAVALDSRPEGIVLTPQHIWTSGAVLDRDTLTATEIGLGFTIARGPDGSIWGTAGIPSSSTAESIAVRWAPGDYTD